VSTIALKIDVDTYRGTREGVPRLAALLERLDVRATFLFSLGPDHTGRAIKRAFRRGFMGKVKRTSVLQHYGLKTLLYGVLLPGPHIGRSCRAEMQAIDRQGFDVGVHTYDHVKWQDGVCSAKEAWTRRQLTLARDQFSEVFGRPPLVHGAAGWQVNQFVPALEEELGFRYASDVRGTAPFTPLVDGIPVAVAQLPTTLPTFDELIGREDLGGIDPVEHLLKLTSAKSDKDHVFTLHAELEGGAYLSSLERLVKAWRASGRRVTDLATYVDGVELQSLPCCRIVAGTVQGRSGTLASQAEDSQTQPTGLASVASR
jgi:peptidoglycan/xylan/chitin deacetylase (PgdA/CDA1 family)